MNYDFLANFVVVSLLLTSILISFIGFSRNGGPKAS